MSHRRAKARWAKAARIAARVRPQSVIVTKTTERNPNPVRYRTVAGHVEHVPTLLSGYDVRVRDVVRQSAYIGMQAQKDFDAFKYLDVPGRIR